MKILRIIDRLLVIILVGVILWADQENKRIVKELKELQMTMEAVEIQIKLLTPPPEFFELPVARKSEKSNY